VGVDDRSGRDDQPGRPAGESASVISATVMTDAVATPLDPSLLMPQYPAHPREQVRRVRAIATSITRLRPAPGYPVCFGQEAAPRGHVHVPRQRVGVVLRPAAEDQLSVRWVGL
jgi:hypothetical protein